MKCVFYHFNECLHTKDVLKSPASAVRLGPNAGSTSSKPDVIGAWCLRFYVRSCASHRLRLEIRWRESRPQSSGGGQSHLLSSCPSPWSACARLVLFSVCVFIPMSLWGRHGRCADLQPRVHTSDHVTLCGQAPPS